jgi:hypothetical protein
MEQTKRHSHLQRTSLHDLAETEQTRTMMPMSRLPYLKNILAKAATEPTESTEPKLTCADCALFRGRSCGFYKVYTEAYPTDLACGDYKPKESTKTEMETEIETGRGGRAGRAGSAKRKKTYTLALYENIPPTFKPCGFYGDTLTESVWLPYKDEEGTVSLRPSVIVAKRNMEPEVKDFLQQDTIKGTFPSQDLTSLMTPKAVQMLVSHMNLEPQDIDNQINQAINKHVSIPIAERILAKRWIEGTHFYDVFDAYAIQNILGVSESGKSRLSLLNLSLCYHAEGLIDPTEASIFRSKEEEKVSLIIDEAEYLNNPNLYSTLKILLNASYSKHSGYVTRYDEIDGKRIKRRFDLYSPLSISGIAGLEGVTASRAFKIVMRRVDKDYPKANPTEYTQLRDMLYALRIKHAFEVSDIYKKTDISNIVSARFEELFKPLFALTSWLGTKEEWNILKDWCSEYQATFRIEALNVAAEEQLLLCITKLSKTNGQPDWYNLKELADKINAEYNRKVSSGYVTNILTRLGIMKRKKIRGYTFFYCSEELLEESMQRIGLSPVSSPVSTASTNSTQQQPNKEWYDEQRRLEEKASQQAQTEP